MMAQTSHAPIPSVHDDSHLQRNIAHGPRPLYLLTRGQCSIKLDGPALVISIDRRVKARYPFERISRVVSAQRVEWSAQALNACIRSNRCPESEGDSGHGFSCCWIGPVASGMFSAFTSRSQASVIKLTQAVRCVGRPAANVNCVARKQTC